MMFIKFVLQVVRSSASPLCKMKSSVCLPVSFELVKSNRGVFFFFDGLLKNLQTEVSNASSDYCIAFKNWFSLSPLF